MSFKEQLRADMTAAMKARDELRTATLRMVLAAITNEEVAGKQARELSDDEVVKVVAREAKKRREAAEAFDGGGRPELAERERAEGEVLAAYLPAQLSDEELTGLVSVAIASAGEGVDQPLGPKQMGAVMKLVTPQVAGRAEGGRVAAEVRRQLGG
ncbi:MAG TPA: GatB/YqeY domain-containing protein [Mycobacteriales bacterium]|nr:GatB/YqeY domain-containing protein [Mycobacteriales bacterium]